MDIAGVDVEIDVIKEYPELEDLVVNSSTEDQNFSSNKYGFKSVKINAIKGEELDLTPSTAEQNVEGVFTKVKVNPIKTQKLNTVPSTQEQVITGLFDEVTVNAIEGEELNLNPSEEKQNFEGVFLGVNINPIQVEEITTDLDFSSSDVIELTAQEGAYMKKATIKKDASLSPENIKSGVTVCGVSGDVADTSDATATAEDIAEGKTAYVNNVMLTGTMKVSDDNATLDGTVLTTPSILTLLKSISKLDLSSATSVSNLFNGATSLVTVTDLDVRNATKVTNLFKDCTSLETVINLDISSVQFANQMFMGCSKLKKVIFANVSISTLSNTASMFRDSSSLEEIPLFDTSMSSSLAAMFQGCSSLVTIPPFDTSTNQSFQNIVEGCTSLSDESLNNLLSMFANAPNVTTTKTLVYAGLTSDQATRCQSLSNYQAFLDARMDYRLLKI